MNILAYENIQELKTHGDLNFPFNIYPCSIPLDFSSVPLHWHNDMEILFIKKGQGIVSVNLADHMVSAGDIILICPGQLHRIEQKEDQTMEYENIIFQINMLMSTQTDLCNDQFFHPLLQGTAELPTHIPYSTASEFYSICRNILDAIDRLSGQGDALSALGIKGQLFLFLHTVYRFKNSVETVKLHSGLINKSLDTMKCILKHVENHYRDRLTIGQMAELCHLSESHFMKFFKQTMGVSFIDYLNDYRLTMAARMLSASPDPIVSIAAETGFENLSYFNRMFKRKFKMTPSAFRRKQETSV